MSSALLSSTLDHLRALVGIDTTNPPRDAARARRILELVAASLRDCGYTCDPMDFGEGCRALFAIRGKRPRLLFNNHLDTVPAAEGWSTDPWTLSVAGDRAIGLGACDVKGAAACWLAAAQQTDGDAAMLFTTDEEAGQSVCLRSFLKERRDVLASFDAVIVAEPTGCRAVTAHRGLATSVGVFTGTPGHGSSARALRDSAIHEAVRWAAAAIEHARGCEGEAFGPLTGVRFNIGTFEGGIKANMIAPAAELRFGFRPLPSHSIDGLHDTFRGFAAAEALAHYEETFRGPSLPSGGDTADKFARAEALVAELGLPVGPAVDFWTEASLFSAAGLTAIVYGPGDIAQAHTADEWVELAQLQAVAQTYLRLFA